MTTKSRGRGRTTVAEPPRHWRFTVEKYQRMAEVGILTNEDRVELIDGEIYAMAPIGNWHNAAVDALNAGLKVEAGQRAIVRVQGSFRLSADSAPEPDILVLRFKPDYYRSALPSAEDVLLIVEVADSSLAYDRDFKLPLYARTRIPEVWIAVRAEAHVEAYRDPEGETYRTRTIHQRGSSLSPLAFPDITIAVEDIVG
jgi:Uma2 family endonuclease